MPSIERRTVDIHDAIGESRKLNKKFEYPPARNSPAFKAMFGPNTTRGPESFISKFKSAQSTVRLAPSGPTTALPSTRSSKIAETGVVVKVVAFPSLALIEKIRIVSSRRSDSPRDRRRSRSRRSRHASRATSIGARLRRRREASRLSAPNSTRTRRSTPRPRRTHRNSRSRNHPRPSRHPPTHDARTKIDDVQSSLGVDFDFVSARPRKTNKTRRLASDLSPVTARATSRARRERKRARARVKSMRRTIHRVIVSPHRVVANRPSSPRIPSRCRSEKPKRPSNAHHLSRRRTATARARHRRRPARARIFFSSPVISRCHLARAVASRRALTDSHRIAHTHRAVAREGDLK